MVSEFILGISLTVGGIIISIVGGILAYLFKNFLSMKEDLNALKKSYGGDQFDDGHLMETRREFERINSHLDDVEDLVCSVERRRKEEHEEVKEILEGIIFVLKDEDIGGDLPEPSDD